MKFSKILAYVTLAIGTASAVAIPVQVRDATAVALPVSGISTRAAFKVKLAPYDKQKRQDDDGEDDDGDDEDGDDDDGEDDEGDDDGDDDDD